MTRAARKDAGDWRTREQRRDDEQLVGTWYRCRVHGLREPTEIWLLGDVPYCAHDPCDEQVLLAHSASRSTEETDWTRTADRKNPHPTRRRWTPGGGTPTAAAVGRGPVPAKRPRTGPPASSPIQAQSPAAVDDVDQSPADRPDLVQAPAPTAATHKKEKPSVPKASRTTLNKTDVILAALDGAPNRSTSEIRTVVAALLGERAAKRGPLSGSLHQLRARGLIDASAPGRWCITGKGRARAPADFNLARRVAEALEGSGESPTSTRQVPGDAPAPARQEPAASESPVSDSPEPAAAAASDPPEPVGLDGCPREPTDADTNRQEPATTSPDRPVLAAASNGKRIGPSRPTNADLLGTPVRDAPGAEPWPPPPLLPVVAPYDSVRLQVLVSGKVALDLTVSRRHCQYDAGEILAPVRRTLSGVSL